MVIMSGVACIYIMSLWAGRVSFHSTMGLVRGWLASK